MNMPFATERIFALSAFEGVRLIRLYVAKQPDTALEEILVIISHVEADASGLDMEAAVYLHGLVDSGCPLDGIEFYQACISAIVTKHQPNWCKAMRQGRMRFLDSLDRNDRDIFVAAGIAANPVQMAVVKWWDTVTGFARLAVDLEKMAQGREAEMLSLNHETGRLADLGLFLTPEWKGIDDNFAGYDILSYDVGNPAPISRMIEVKSTTAKPLSFIVTRNEWNQAEKIGAAYNFHIWDMSKNPPVLHERTLAQVAINIPEDNAEGEWKTALIPIGPD